MSSLEMYVPPTAGCGWQSLVSHSSWPRPHSYLDRFENGRVDHRQIWQQTSDLSLYLTWDFSVTF